MSWSLDSIFWIIVYRRSTCYLITGCSRSFKISSRFSESMKVPMKNEDDAGRNLLRRIFTPRISPLTFNIITGTGHVL
jgi:hypothetical protein